MDFPTARQRVLELYPDAADKHKGLAICAGLHSLSDDKRLECFLWENDSDLKYFLEARFKHLIEPQGPVEYAWKHPSRSPANGDVFCVGKRVSPVVHNGICKGTACRIAKSGLVVGAYYVHVKDGQFLDMTAFGDVPLKLIAGFPYYGIILMQGAPCADEAEFFDLGAIRQYAPGIPVTLIAQALAPEKELSKPDTPLQALSMAQGIIVARAPTFEISTADYNAAAIPNSLGGAVMFDTNRFAGVHVGTAYQRDYGDDYPEQEKVKAPMDRIDTDPQNMFNPSSEAVQMKKKEKRDSQNDNQLQPAQHAHTMHNIKHKDQLAYFVPAPYIVALAQRAGAMGTSMFHQPFSKRSNRQRAAT